MSGTSHLITFAAMVENGSVVAVVELDDRTHDARKDSKRDAMLTGAGYKIVRWSSKMKPDAATIRAELATTAPDFCTSHEPAQKYVQAT